MSRFEEGLRIVHGLLRHGKVDFVGRYYEARECVLEPRGPRPGGPPILIGSTGERMLGLLARYGDPWNAYFTPTKNRPSGIARPRPGRRRLPPGRARPRNDRPDRRRVRRHGAGAPGIAAAPPALDLRAAGRAARSGLPRSSGPTRGRASATCSSGSSRTRWRASRPSRPCSRFWTGSGPSAGAGQRSRYNAAMRMAAVRGLALTAAVAALATPAHPQVLPAPPAASSPAAWSRFALPNGVVVLVAERPGVPDRRRPGLGGRRRDPRPRRQEGLANLTALLLTAGTRPARRGERPSHRVRRGEASRATGVAIRARSCSPSSGRTSDSASISWRMPCSGLRFQDPEFARRRRRSWRRCAVRRRTPRRSRRASCDGWCSRTPVRTPDGRDRDVAQGHHSRRCRGIPSSRLPARADDRRGGGRHHRGGAPDRARGAPGRLVDVGPASRFAGRRGLGLPSAHGDGPAEPRRRPRSSWARRPCPEASDF